MRINWTFLFFCICRRMCYLTLLRAGRPSRYLGDDLDLWWRPIYLGYDADFWWAPNNIYWCHTYCGAMKCLYWLKYSVVWTFIRQLCKWIEAVNKHVYLGYVWPARTCLLVLEQLHVLFFIGRKTLCELTYQSSFPCWRLFSLGCLVNAPIFGFWLITHWSISTFWKGHLTICWHAHR